MAVGALSVNEIAHEVQGSACPIMAKAELGWRRFANMNSGAHACPQWGRGAPRKMHARSWPRPNKGRGTSCVA